jgi:hypothetical protein
MDKDPGRGQLQWIRIELHLISAHQGIEGNELADKLAKEATGWRQTQGRGRRIIQVNNSTPTPPFLRSLRSASRTELSPTDPANVEPRVDNWNQMPRHIRTYANPHMHHTAATLINPQTQSSFRCERGK